MFSTKLFIHHKIKTILFLIISLVLVSCFIIFRTIIQTSQAITLASQLQLENAATIAKKNHQQAAFFNTITFRQIALFKTMENSLKLLIHLPESKTAIENNLIGLIDTTNQNANLNTVLKEVEYLSTQTKVIEQQAQASLFIRKQRYLKKLSQINTTLDELTTILTKLSSEPHTIIVLLQNSDEIRASGGFMGSYARIDIREGKISSIAIQDIYEPDGQFQGFVDAPPGAREYLSGGEGLRLPDANWHPDFPTTAKTISSYFAFGNERQIDTVITMNVDLMEKMLKIMGEIYLPDYGVTVTADNLTALARADRDSFFAGSKQKTNFLSALFDQVKLRFVTLDQSQQTALASMLVANVPNKQLQFFSWHESLQKLFEKYQLTGALQLTNDQHPYFYLVESNVGINKANKFISRSVVINAGKNRSEISMTFDHSGNKEDEDYINYQRLITKEDSEVINIQYGGNEVNFTERIIKNSKGQKFKEIGFLIPLQTNTSQTLKIALQNTNDCDETCTIEIQKQSGLPPTAYQLRYTDTVKNIILEKDEQITL